MTDNNDSGDYKSYENDDYHVFDDGRVWSTVKERFVPRMWRADKEYYQVPIIVDGKRHKRCLHTIVFRLFKGAILPGHEIRFVDGDRKNVCVDNLVQAPKNEPRSEIAESNDGSEWRDVLGYAERYSVNADAVVLSAMKTLRPLKMYKSSTGPYVKLTTASGKRTSTNVALIVWEAFHGRIKPASVVKHIDGDVHNCKLENLELVERYISQHPALEKHRRRGRQPVYSADFVDIGSKYDGVDLSFYSINLFGQVKTKYHRILQQRERNGRNIVSFQKTVRKCVVYVDILVALCFIPNPNGYTMVRHKDGDTRNDRVENLEWVVDNPAIQKRERAVTQWTTAGEFVATYDSIADAYRALGKVPNTGISKVCDGRQKTCQGYHWGKACP